MLWRWPPARLPGPWGHPQATDFVAHLQQAYHCLPGMQCYDWVMDNLNTHWSLDVCRLVARWCKVPFGPTSSKPTATPAFLPSAPPSCLSFHPETCSCSIKPSYSLACCTVAFWPVQFYQRQGLCTPLSAFATIPSRPSVPLTYREPLVRDTPFSHTTSAASGRACFSPRPKPLRDYSMRQALPRSCVLINLHLYYRRSGLLLEFRQPV